MNLDDPFQVEECMQRQIEKHHAELHARAAALQAWPTPCRRWASSPRCWAS